jgi:multiple sugar transport system permease protein
MNHNIDKTVKPNRLSKDLLIKTMITVFTGLFALTMIIPFIWMLSASMKIGADVIKLPIKWIPDYFYPDNYLEVWNFGGLAKRDYHFNVAYFNSLKIALINMIGALITSAAAGYAFAKIPFRGRNGIFLLYLATMMIPSQITLIPKYTIFSFLGLNGTHWPLILPGIITITGTFLMRQYFMQVPNDLRESAYIDGANEFRIWFRIMLPIAKPAMASLGMIVFLWNWNNYLDALVFLANWRLYTIPVALTNFIDESYTEYNLIMAASATALVPVFLIFLGGQKFFVKGLIAGAVKG